MLLKKSSLSKFKWSKLSSHTNQKYIKKIQMGLNKKNKNYSAIITFIL